jgi:hypothetical protein
LPIDAVADAVVAIGKNGGDKIFWFNYDGRSVRLKRLGVLLNGVDMSD